MAKFCINHPYLFTQSREAFFITVLTFFTVQMVEMANILLCLCTGDTISMISNFVSMIIVAQFDEFVFAAMKEEPLKELVKYQFTEKAFVI